MEKEKKSIVNVIVSNLKKAYSFLNKDITGSKKSKNKKNQDVSANESSVEENVFDQIENNTVDEKVVSEQEKSIEEEVIPDAKQVEAETIIKTVEESEKEVEEVVESVIDEVSVESDDEKINERKILEVDNTSNEKSNESNLETIAPDNIAEEKEPILEINKNQQEPQSEIDTEIVVEKSNNLEDKVYSNINSIIRPDSVLSYLDDIVLHQEHQKNKQVIKKVYKKNKNSHVISPE